MIKGFKYRDLLYAQSNNKSVNNDKKLINIFRMLSGTCAILDKYSNDIYRQEINYLSVPYYELDDLTDVENIENDIFLADFEDFTVDQLFNSMQTFNRQNTKFYELIESEIVNCLIARNKERYIESFLFIYRLLEGMSFVIPLMYTAKSRNYTKSFDSLKKFLINNSDGEILFFKRFLKDLYSDSDFYTTTRTIKFDSIHIEELRPIYFNRYKQMIKDKDIISEVEDEEIEISFMTLFELLIELRNRYFHFLQGTWHDNIATREIIYPDLFFKPIVDLGINWIAMIVLENIKFEIDSNSLHHNR